LQSIIIILRPEPATCSAFTSSRSKIVSSLVLSFLSSFFEVFYPQIGCWNVHDGAILKLGLVRRYGHFSSSSVHSTQLKQGILNILINPEASNPALHPQIGSRRLRLMSR
jgi:hypothetical protein